MKLGDYAHTLFVDPAKFVGYALNATHPKGKHKARVCTAVLGYTSTNYDALLQQIVAKALDGEAIWQRNDQFGQHLRVDLMIDGVQGSDCPCTDRLACKPSRGHRPIDHRLRLVRRKFMIKPTLYDVIELIVAIPEENLPAGMQGTLVHQHDNHIFEVEFINDLGETMALCALNRRQFVIVWQSATETAVSVAEQIAQVVELLPATARSEVLDFARFLSTKQAVYPLAA